MDLQYYSLVVLSMTELNHLQGQEHGRSLSSSSMFFQEWQIQNKRFLVLSYFLTQSIISGKFFLRCMLSFPK